VKFPFLPREEGFFDLFEESARNMVKAAQSLKQLVDTWQDVEQKVSEITELEHQGDTITQLLTPICTSARPGDILKMTKLQSERVRQ